jgi:hypothetical protein
MTLDDAYLYGLSHGLLLGALVAATFIAWYTKRVLPTKHIEDHNCIIEGNGGSNNAND